MSRRQQFDSRSPYYNGDDDDVDEAEPLTPQVPRHEDDDEWTPKPFFTLSNFKYASQSVIHSNAESSHKPRITKTPMSERHIQARGSAPRSVASMAHAVSASFSMERPQPTASMPIERPTNAVPKYEMDSPVEDLMDDMLTESTKSARPTAPDISLFDMTSPDPSAPLDMENLDVENNLYQKQPLIPQPSAPDISQLLQPVAPSGETGATIHANSFSAPSVSQLTTPSFSMQSAGVPQPQSHVPQTQSHVPQTQSSAAASPTYSISPSVSRLTSPSFSMQSGLVGLSIDESSPESEYTEPSFQPAPNYNRRVSFDLEANHGLPQDDLTRASSQQISVIAEEPETIGHAPRLKRIISHIPWRAWAGRVNHEIDRVAFLTTSELRHISQVTSSAAIRVLGLSTVLQNLNDLKYLEQKHQEKMGHIRRVHGEEHYDYALVLTAQEVYAFWADHLDFRTEYLGEDPTEETTENLEEAQAMEKAYMEAEETIDARPFVTPLTGIRNRRGRSSPENGMTMELPTSDGLFRAPRTAPVHSSREATFSRGLSSVGGSGRPTLKKRMSLFDRAVDVLSPRGSSSFRSAKVFNEELSQDPKTVSQKKLTPSMSSARRRRWGNRQVSGGPGDSTPDLISPPVRSLKRSSSVRKRLSKKINSSQPSVLEEEEETPQGKRQKQNPNSLRIEDIPTQVIPRGIAARTHGMERFLSALKRGIVLRRHRPNAEAVFCKLLSTDGGDTIQYQYVDTEEAMLAFKEQRVRYNKKLGRKGSPNFVRSISKRWSYRESTNSEEDVKTFSLPDFIAAKQYRQRQIEQHGGVKQQITEFATQVANSGSVQAKHLIAVHPARHEDPRSEMAEFGTATLRRSKSEYYVPHSFSLVTVGRQWLKGQSSNKVASEKWHSGEGSEVQFNYLDFEAATEGEYWLIFRGFLLLHRDAASGRFAHQRAAGFGSNYGRREQEQQQQGSEEDVNSSSVPPGSLLPKEQFHEPPTVGWLEYLVAKLRKTDISYMTGSAVPGAIPPPSDYFLGFRSPGTQIWSRLRQAGLDTQRIYALDTKTVMIKVQCPSDRLMDVGEVLRLKLKTRDGSFVPFRENSLSIYRPSDEPWSPYQDGASLFRSSERQKIIDFIIRSRIRDSGAELGQNTDLGKMVDRRVPLHMHERLDVLYNAWVHFWKKNNWIGRDGRSMTDGSENTHMLPQGASSNSLRLAASGDDDTHLPPDESEVPNILSRVFLGCFHQPLDSVEQYFGEKVAFYFVWLQHCSNHLTVLSAIGLILFICQIATGRWDHPLRPFFSVTVMLWSFVVMCNWRKRSNFLAYKWGTMNVKQQETTRPQFKGEYRRDEITGEWVVYYPPWKRYLKYLISFPLTVAFTVGTLIVILMVHANRDLLLARYYEQKTTPESDQFSFDFSIRAIGQRAPVNAVELNREVLTDPTFWFIIAGLPALLGLCLPLLNLVLMRISVMLNDFENYRTETEYRTHLIIKVFSFRFVCYFAALYYYAYISVGSDQAIENGILRVGTGVFVYMTVAHWWSIFLSVYFPLLVFHLKRYMNRMSLLVELRNVEMQEFMLSGANEESEDVKATKVQLINKRILLEQAQSDIWDEVSLREHDSFPEYIQAVVQFAYVSCFSVVLPIAPLICLVNHLLSMRFDAYKLCRGRRRPLAQKTGGIGVWEHVLHIVTVIAVLTNCFLMGFTNYLFRKLVDKVGNLGTFCIIVGWEHIMLLIKYVMHTTISKFPKSVRDDMKKEEYKQTRQRNSNMRAKKGRRSKRDKDRLGSKRRDSEDQSCSSSQLQHQDSLQETVSYDGSASVRTARSGSDGDETEMSFLLGHDKSSRESYARKPYLPTTLQTMQESKENNRPRTNSRPSIPLNSSVKRGKRLTSANSNSILRSDRRYGNYEPQAPTPRQLHLDGEESQCMESPFGMFMPQDEIQTPPIPQTEVKEEGRDSDVLQSFLQDGDSPMFEDDANETDLTSHAGRYYQA